MTFLEVASVVVTWWIVAGLRSGTCKPLYVLINNNITCPLAYHSLTNTHVPV